MTTYYLFIWFFKDIDSAVIMPSRHPPSIGSLQSRLGQHRGSAGPTFIVAKSAFLSLWLVEEGKAAHLDHRSIDGEHAGRRIAQNAVCVVYLDFNQVR